MKDRMSSELDLVEWIRGYPQDIPSSILTAAGDDCAVLHLPAGSNLAVSSDMLIENVHFRRRWTNPRFLGQKALAVNLSDLAAVGAKPWACLLNLALPRELSGGYFQAFMEGFFAEANRWRSPLIGGDLSQSREITVGVTVLGDLEGRTALLRSTARDQDALLLIGDVGYSRLGLALLEERNPEGLMELAEGDLSEWAGDPLSARCVAAHLLPSPRLTEARWLAENGLANCMIDVSDGLSSDLLHLLRGSSLEAELEVERIPLPDGEVAGISPLDAALDGGEDYAILFSASGEQVERIQSKYPPDFSPCRVIGHLSSGTPAVYLRRSGKKVPHHAKGFDHFK